MATSYSPDGKQMALTFRSQVGRNWKRYRGGWKADIHIFNFQTESDENISANEEAGDEFPMWHGNAIYFLSDRGSLAASCPQNLVNVTESSNTVR